MIVDKRKHSRITEIGKVESQDLCLFPGVLVDVSKVGCRVRFPTSFLVDTWQAKRYEVLPLADWTTG